MLALKLEMIDIEQVSKTFEKYSFDAILFPIRLELFSREYLFSPEFPNDCPRLLFLGYGDSFDIKRMFKSLLIAFTVGKE